MASEGSVQTYQRAQRPRSRTSACLLGFATEISGEHLTDTIRVRGNRKALIWRQLEVGNPDRVANLVIEQLPCADLEDGQVACAHIMIIMGCKVRE
eukprot:m.161584 g.161584  ORF g.161584 m.161584 type:complete len:96 (+) comp53040_c0_seq46:638-925(+)